MYTMRKSSYDYPAKQQIDSDYYSHVHKMARAPSVLTETPHYPLSQPLFNNNTVPLNQDHRGNRHNQYQQPKHGHNNSEPVKRVFEVTERVTECDINGNCTVFEEKIDVEADDYIEQKHKGFELCKWKTYKAH